MFFLLTLSMVAESWPTTGVVNGHGSPIQVIHSCGTSRLWVRLGETPISYFWLFPMISILISYDWLMLTSFRWPRLFVLQRIFRFALRPRWSRSDRRPRICRRWGGGAASKHIQQEASSLGRLPMLGHQEQASILCKEDLLGTGKNWTSKLFNLKISSIVYRHSR